MAKKEKETDKKTIDKDKESKSKTEKKASKKVDKTKALEEELQEAKDKYLRLYSEFENFRRRTAKEKLDLVGTANEGLIQAMLPVMDDFERAEKSMTEESDVKSVREGVDLIYNKFKSVLEQKGVKKIEADKGSEFDLELHEAITQIPAPEEDLQGKIVDVVENGYQLNEKVIRFAKVVTGA